MSNSIEVVLYTNGFNSEVYNALGSKMSEFEMSVGLTSYSYDTSSLVSGTDYLVLSNNRNQKLESRFLIVE